MMVKGRTFGEIWRGHRFEGDAQTVLERIDLQGGIAFFLEGPTELIGSKDDVGEAFVFSHGPVEGDMGNGELADFRFAAGFVIDVETEPDQALDKTDRHKLFDRLYGPDGREFAFDELLDSLLQGDTGHGAPLAGSGEPDFEHLIRTDVDELDVAAIPLQGRADLAQYFFNSFLQLLHKRLLDLIALLSLE